MTQIVVLSGRKQSGKTTCRNFLYGYIMKYVGVIDKFAIKHDGTLWVPTQFEKDGEIISGMGGIDPDDSSLEFAAFARERIWPFIKSYSFADELKQIAINVFGASYNQCYGTDDEKNTPIGVKWKDIKFCLSAADKRKFAAELKSDDCITARKFLQVFGTEICRRLAGNCWVDACFRKIDREQPNLAIITDARFPNEVQASLDYDATVVRFTRGPFKGQDEHESETALDEWDTDPELRAKYSLFCENDNMSIAEQNDYILENLTNLGALPEKRE